MTTFQLEGVREWWKDAKYLAYDHWQELGLDIDLKNDLDVDKLEQLGNLGCWLTMTAREDGALIGYAVGVFSPHLHYKSSGPMMIVDMYYVVPLYRTGVGVKLFKFMESVTKAKGAIKIYLSCKVHKDHSDLFKALGYRLSDYAFTKRIG